MSTIQHNLAELGKGQLKTAILSGGTSNVVLTLDRTAAALARYPQARG